MFLLIFCAAIVAQAGITSVPVRAQDKLKIIIIVHKDNGAKKADYPQDELKKIFLKQTTTWKDDSKIVPYQLSSGTKEASLFRKKVLQKDSKALKKYWNDKQADDGVSEPLSKKKSSDIFKLICKKKSRIGYINAEYYDGLTEEEQNKIKSLGSFS